MFFNDSLLRMPATAAGIRLRAGALFLSLILSLSCDIKSPVENVKVLFNEAPLPAIVAVEVVDAGTGEQIALDNDLLYLIIDGPDKDAIINMSEKPQTTFSSASGYFNFAVAEGHEVSPEHPITITIIVKSKGFITVSRSLSITSSQGETCSIALVRRDSTPAGATTTVKVGGAANASGEVTESIDFTAEPEPETGTKVSVKIHEGTIIKNQTGDALSGALTTNLTRFNAKSEESLNAFPGGLLAQVTGPEGGSKEAVFNPVGFISLEITDEAGNEAKTFDRPVEISLQIPGDTFNPETRAAIKNGDTIPIWYYDEAAARWVFETNGTAYGPDAAGNYDVPFTITHFSFWSGGWVETSTPCESGLLVHVTGGFTAVDIRIKQKSDGTYISSLRKNVSSADPTYRLPPSMNTTPIIIEAWYGSDIVGSIEPEFLCDTEVSLSVDIPGLALSVTVEVYCENDPERRMRPSRGIYIDDNGKKKYVGFLDEGRITVYGLESGVTYTFYVFDEGSWYSDTYTVTKTSESLEFPVPEDRCN